MKKILFLLILIVSFTSFGQKYLTRNATITFFSEAPLENIEAVNKSVNAVVKSTTGDLAFKVVMKDFYFEKAAMQNHFNTKYIESDKYPNATFIGKIDNYESLDLSSTSEQQAKVTGTLTIHGVAKPLNADIRIQKKSDKLYIKSMFPVDVKDYNITIPSKSVSNISEVIDVTVDAVLDQIK